MSPGRRTRAQGDPGPLAPPPVGAARFASAVAVSRRPLLNGSPGPRAGRVVCASSCGVRGSCSARLPQSAGKEIDMAHAKCLLILGLSLAGIGAAIITFVSGVPWVLPNRPRTSFDVWLWRGAFALITAGTALQIIATALSP